MNIFVEVRREDNVAIGFVLDRSLGDAIWRRQFENALIAIDSTPEQKPEEIQ